MSEKVVLDNGATILLEPVPASEAVSIGLWINLGSRDEGPHEHGCAHFTEHMLFKGTKNRSLFDIALEIDSLGGEINGVTGKENTYYYVNVAAEHYRRALDVLLDMFFNSLFNVNDFKTEKGIILDEIILSMDDPEDLLNELFSRTLWDNHPIALPVMGESEDIENLSRETLLKFYQKHYTLEKLIISAAGNIQISDFRAVAEELLLLHGHRSHTSSVEVTRAKPDSFIKSSIEIRPVEEVYFMCGAEAFGYHDERRYPMILLNMIAGSSFSSRLFQRIRERMGLCYSISSGFSSFSDTGEFTISFSSNVAKLPFVIDAIIKELELIAEGDITREELERAKDRFYGNYILSKESVEWKMVKMAAQEIIYGAPIPFSKTLEKIRGVTIDDISELAEAFFKGRSFSYASVGPPEQRKYLEGLSLSID
ncbi:MAG: M16 family metallopeptidase [Spirochaetota bacterium]